MSSPSVLPPVAPQDVLPPSVVAACELVRALRVLGVRDVVLAPGSRSAPLAYALMAAVRAPHEPGAAAAKDGPDVPSLRLHVRIDERDAGFLALGIARAGQLRTPGGAPPVAVVTTSGTAVANLHPAVLEAHHAGVPLLLLTADRPHEMRGTGANQTADQVGIFAAAVRLAVDVPAPTGRAGELQDVRSVASRAVAAATGARSGHPGPAHLNLAYRDPLAPDAAGLVALSALSHRSDGDDTGLVRVHGAGPERAVQHDAASVVGTRVVDEDPVGALGVLGEPATVVVAGDSAGPLARRLAEARGWPLLAEASSGAAGGPNLVAAHRLVLGAGGLAGRVRQVVVLGRPTLSRPVQTLLADPGVRVVVVAPGSAQWPDAARNATCVLAAVPTSWLEPAEPGAWLRDWTAASGIARATVDRCLADARTSAGPQAPMSALEVVAAVAQASRPQDVLVVGSSNPVRDLDLVAAWDSPPRIVANRGLAGIDGTLATVTGVALGTQDPRVTDDPPVVRALMGDLTFLHDVGGLLHGPLEDAVSVQVVVVNDDGGSIFATLEHGRLGDPELFERVFATPHGANVGLLCAGYGVQHELVHSETALRRALAHRTHGVSVLEVQVDRAGRGDDARALAAAVVEAVGAVVPAGP